MSEKGGKELLIKRVHSQAVTFAEADDTVVLAAHGLANGQVVSFSVVTTTTGITANTNYYVVAATTGTFKVALTAGGDPIALTNDGTGTVVFSLVVAGLRSKSLSINAEAIDISSDDSAEWRKTLDEAGMRSVSVSGSGVFSTAKTLADARADTLANKIRTYEVVLHAGGDKITGPFKITGMEQSGEYNGEMSYSLSLESADACAFTAGV